MTPEEQSQTKLTIKIIYAGFVAILILVMAFAVIALYSNNKHAELNNKIYQHPFAVSIAVLEANGKIISMHRYMKDVVLANDEQELESAIAQVNQNEREALQYFEIINARFLGDKRKMNDAYVSFIDWQPIREEVITLKRKNQHKKAAAITKGKGAEYVKKLNEKMEYLVEFARNKASEFNEVGQRSFDLGKKHFYLLSIFVMLFSCITVSLVVYLFRKMKHANDESEARFKAIFNHAEISIWSEDLSLVIEALDKLRADGIVDLKPHLQANIDLAWQLAGMIKVNSVNDATLRLFGAKTQDEFIKKIDKTFGDNAIDVFIDELCAIWNKDEMFLSEANFKSLDGKEIQALITCKTSVKTNDYTNIPISIVDISEQKSILNKLKLSSRVFNDTHEGIIITDEDGVIINVNPAFSQSTGYKLSDILGKTPSLLSSGKHSPEYYASMWKQITSAGFWQGEIWNRKKNGEVYAAMLTISSLKSTEDEVVNYLGMFTDITQSKRQQESIHRLAHYDALTGLCNRTLLQERFNQAIAHSKRSGSLLAICFLDLDDFKPVNDNFGHEIGDKLLIEVARRLELAVRTEDTVSRLGGDEFALLLGDLNSTTQCCEVLSRVIELVSTPFVIDEHTIVVGSSIGVSIFPSDGSALDSLLRQADQAMYQAKQQGKQNFQFFDLEQTQEKNFRHEKLKEIKEALENNELCLYYQPKINMASGKIMGVEALIRWQHPEKGLIPPVTFLPIIESSVLEIDIGDWVIEQAMAQLEVLNKHKIFIEMSVNVSSLQLLNESFVDRLKVMLKRHRTIDPSYFNLEILESSTLGDLEHISNIINTCRDELGFSVALDDFGTGYSSLSHLSQLPADMIKIDQSFVRNLLKSPNDFAIIDGVIGLAKSFSRSLIAEGVETIEDGQMLLLMGCDNAQGYVIAKPMPADQLVEWIGNYKPNQMWLKKSPEELTPQGVRIKQFELIMNHWLKKVELLAEAEVGETEDISHLDYYVNQWIRRLRDDRLFDDVWIIKLEQSYQDMCLIAKDLIISHQKHMLITEQEEQRKLRKAYEKVLSILGSGTLKTFS